MRFKAWTGCFAAALLVGGLTMGCDSTETGEDPLSESAIGRARSNGVVPTDMSSTAAAGAGVGTGLGTGAGAGTTSFDTSVSGTAPNVDVPAGRASAGPASAPATAPGAAPSAGDKH